FINSIRPVTYTVNIKRLNEYFNKRNGAPSEYIGLDKNDEAANMVMQKSADAAADIPYDGFIAQEVEEAAKKLNFQFSGIDKPQSNGDLYGLRYDNFV